MTKEGKRESGEAIPNTNDYLKIRRFFKRMKKMDDMPERIEVFPLNKERRILMGYNGP